MKTIKTIISIAAMAALTIGCTAKFGEYNTDPYSEERRSGNLDADND